MIVENENFTILYMLDLCMNQNNRVWDQINYCFIVFI